MKQLIYENTLETSISKKETNSTLEQQKESLDTFSNENKKKKKRNQHEYNITDSKDKSLNINESNNLIELSFPSKSNCSEITFNSTIQKLNNESIQLKVNNNNKAHFHFSSHKREVVLKGIPSHLMKTFKITLIMFFMSICFISVGVYRSFICKSVNNWLPFVIIGFLIGIPGWFYTFQFWRLANETNVIKREDIIEMIPLF